MTKNVGMLLLSIYLILVGDHYAFSYCHRGHRDGRCGAAGGHFNFSRQVAKRPEEETTAYLLSQKLRRAEQRLGCRSQAAKL